MPGYHETSDAALIKGSHAFIAAICMLSSASSVASMARSLGPLGTMRIMAAKVWLVNLKWDLAGHFSKLIHHARTYPEHRGQCCKT